MAVGEGAGDGLLEEIYSNTVEHSVAVLAMPRSPRGEIWNPSNMPINILPRMQDSNDLQLFSLDSVEDDVTGHRKAADFTR